MNLSCVITRQYTNFHPIHRGTTMTTRTEQIRTAELIKDVRNHKHKEELVQLMYQQIQDDTLVVYKNTDR